MIGVDKMEDIRKRARGGESIASIAWAVGASEPTVRKCTRMEDSSPEPPRRRGPESEIPAAARARERGPRAIQGDDRLLARRPQELAQAAPHGDEGLRETSR